jgi:hypothetical protein
MPADGHSKGDPMIEVNTNIHIGKRHHTVRSHVKMTASEKSGSVGRLTLGGSTIYFDQYEYLMKSTSIDASVILELTLGDFLRLYQQMHELNAAIIQGLDGKLATQGNPG